MRNGCIRRIILCGVWLIDVILIAGKCISMRAQTGSRHEFLITKLYSRTKRRATGLETRGAIRKSLYINKFLNALCLISALSRRQNTFISFSKCK